MTNLATRGDPRKDRYFTRVKESITPVDLKRKMFLASTSTCQPWRVQAIWHHPSIRIMSVKNFYLHVKYYFILCVCYILILLIVAQSTSVNLYFILIYSLPFVDTWPRCFEISQNVHFWFLYHLCTVSSDVKLKLAVKPLQLGIPCILFSGATVI